MIKKRIALFTAALLCAAAVCGCGASKDIDADALAQALLDGGSYAETLSPVSENIVKKRYALTDDMVEKAAAYSGTNAVVDEIAVFKAKDDVDAVAEKAAAHIDAQTELFKSYRPDELSKLRDSVVCTVGDCVAVCVSTDAAKAREIIDGFLK